MTDDELRKMLETIMDATILQKELLTMHLDEDSGAWHHALAVLQHLQKLGSLCRDCIAP